MGITVPVAATVRGARVIEKYFILYRSIGDPDAFFSLNEHEFIPMVKALLEAEMSIGKVDYTNTDKMMKNREFSRLLYAVAVIKSGEKFTALNIRSIRLG